MGFVEEKNFFAEKSYEDLADKRIDYGMMRFSSLSSVRGGEMLSLGMHQDVAHNFSFSSPSGLNFRLDRPCQIF